MEEIIHIVARKIGEDEVNAVDARALHEALGIGKVFAAWMTERIEQLDLAMGVDFSVFSETGKNPLGGRPRIEYALSLDTAKHLAMAERNERGRRVRAFFIAAEKRLRAAPADPLAVFKDPATLRTALLGYVEENLALKTTVSELSSEVSSKSARLEEVAGAIQLHERIETASGNHTFTDAAKMLGVHPRHLVTFLLARGYCYRRSRRSSKTGRLIATEQYLKLKKPLFFVALSEQISGAGESVQAQQTFVTPAGLERFAAELPRWTPPVAAPASASEAAE
jgi:anti-repressor protein